jgi:hypothetical protein
VTGARRRSVSRRTIGLGAAVLVLGFLGWGIARGWDRVRAYDWDLHPGWLALGVSLLAGVYVTSALGYAEIVARLVPAGPPRAQVADIWARSLLGRYVPGSVLMVAGRVVLGAEAGIPRRATLAATVYEQVLALAAAAAAAVVMLAVYDEVSGGAPLWLVAFVPLMVIPLHPRIFRPLTDRALALVRREPLGSTLGSREVAALGVWYAANAVIMGVGVWACVRSAAGPQSGDPILVGGGFLLAFAVSMLVVVFPSGLGVREGVFTLVLAQDLPDEVALTIAVALRLVMTLVEVGFVVGAALLARAVRARQPA